MIIWKLGCRWGRARDGKPLFFEFLKEKNIVIGVHNQDYNVGDLILLTDGYTVLGLAKVKSKPVTVTENTALNESFKKYQIDYEDWLFYADATIIKFSKEDCFTYKLQKGIRRVNQDNIKKKALELWNKYNPKEVLKSEILILPNKKPVVIDLPLNQIMYGPPGTGKTYNTINMALSIIDPEFYEINKDDRESLNEKFKELLYSEENQDGQIVFTTFHQSMSYEDFIEGIKPVMSADSEDMEESKNENLSYEIKAGIFKRICSKAVNSKQIVKHEFDILWDNYFNYLNEQQDEIVFKSIESEMLYINEDSDSNTLRLRFRKGWEKGAEGQKTYPVTKDRIKKIYDNQLDFNDKKLKKWLAIKDILGGGATATLYYAVYKSFFEFSNLSNAFVSENIDSLPHVLIIDEINRGNVSAIFGELITLIETDKRQGMPEALEVTLPYSKESFSVPPNLYIIGTMNTADRSVEALDTALRRRFTFVEMMPNAELLTPYETLKRYWLKRYDDYGDTFEEFEDEEKPLWDLLGLGVKPDKKEDYLNTGNSPETYQLSSIEFKDKIDELVEFKNGINLQTILETINNRIEILLDRDHLIGHSYFMNVYSLEELKETFTKNIIPLLQEYFYGDYGKIALVLGEGFCKAENKIENFEAVFAKVKDYNVNGYSEKKNYRIVSFDDKFKIEEAIDILLNKK
jgi:5-methylcytosine-specific restriction protein B